MILNYDTIKNYFYEAGFRGINLDSAIKICYCESSFNTNAHNTNGEDSRGLMQINVDAHPEYLQLDLFDPVVNTTVAYQIYNETKNFQAWTCAKQLNLINPNEIYFGIALVLFAGIIYVNGV